MLKFSDIENWTIVRGPGEAERAAGVVGLVGAKADGTMVLPDGSSPVSGAGNITAAELLTTTGTLGQTVRLSDGPDQGAILMWSTPQGASSPTWCWWLWPQAAY